jgi:hypothetical protein
VTKPCLVEKETGSKLFNIREVYEPHLFFHIGNLLLVLGLGDYTNSDFIAKESGMIILHTFLHIPPPAIYFTPEVLGGEYLSIY